MTKNVRLLLSGLILCFVLSSIVHTTLPAQETDLKGTKIVLIIASNGFKDEEYQITRELLEKSGAKIVVACSVLMNQTQQGNNPPTSSSGKLQVNPDLTIDRLNVKEYAAIIFIGGSGASEYFANKTAHQIAKDAVENDKILAAICYAPSILAKAGVLNGKKATAWKSEVSKLGFNGATFTDKPVVQDGKIITANGPAASEEFAKTIAQALQETKPAKKEEAPTPEGILDRKDLGITITKLENKEWELKNKPPADFPPDIQQSFVCRLSRYRGPTHNEQEQPILVIDVLADDPQRSFNMGGQQVRLGDYKNWTNSEFEGIKQQWKEIQGNSAPAPISFTFAPNAFQWTISGKEPQNQVPLYIRKIFFELNQKVFLITFQGLAGVERAYESEINFILNNIKTTEISGPKETPNPPNGGEIKPPEPPKKETLKERTFERTDLGFILLKPEGREWELSTQKPEGMQDQQAQSLVCILKRWKTAGTHDPQKERPVIDIMLMAYPKESGFNTAGGRQIAASDLKGLSTNDFERIKEQCSDHKDLKQPFKTAFTFSPNAYEWSFTGIHKQFKVPVFYRSVYFIAEKSTYVMTIHSAAGEDKKYAKELKYIFSNIKTYKPKKK